MIRNWLKSIVREVLAEREAEQQQADNQRLAKAVAAEFSKIGKTDSLRIINLAAEEYSRMRRPGFLTRFFRSIFPAKRPRGHCL